LGQTGKHNRNRFTAENTEGLSRSGDLVIGGSGDLDPKTRSEGCHGRALMNADV